MTFLSVVPFLLKQLNLKYCLVINNNKKKLNKVVLLVLNTPWFQQHLNYYIPTCSQVLLCIKT